MNKDLTVGDPERVLWRFCLPLFGSIIFQQLYNLADSWVAGRYIGENALAAIGNSYQITLIFIAFAFGCNIGTSVLVSRLFGAKDYTGLKTAVYTAFITSGIVCISLMCIGFLSFVPVLQAVHTPADLMGASTLYMNIYILGLPFVFYYNISTGIFSALGDSQTPFCFLAASSLANILMDILFVIRFDLGVAGVAWATFLCQGVSCVLALFFILRRLSAMQTAEKPALFSGKMFRQFVIIAVPSTIQQSFISVGNMIIQGTINVFGSGVIAGYAAGVKINNLIITSFTTIGNGISNYTSQNIGARKSERIGLGFKAGIKLVWIISLPVFLLYFIFSEALVRFFIDIPSADAIRSGVLYLRILSPFYFVVSAKLVSDGILRGAEKMRFFMIGTFSDLILRVVLAILLSRTPLGYLGIWCAWPVGWCISTAISIFFYRKTVRG